jgi:DSF synthase
MTFIQSAKPLTTGFSPAVSMKMTPGGSGAAINALSLYNEIADRDDADQPYRAVATRHYRNLDTCVTEEDRAFWYYLKPQTRPSFTRELLADLADMQLMVKQRFADGETPFDYAVLGSRSQDIFSLGGDLTLFAEKIRDRDRDALLKYAHACVEIVHANHTGLGNNVTTIAMVQGDALGGGFEAALSCDVLIAERQTKFGLPEVLFNLFPGMGAYSLLSRRVGMLKAEEIILSGKTYTAEEMLAIGAIDMVVEQGEGEQAVRAYIARNRSRQLALATVCKVRRRVNPISLDELRDVTEMWVDAALRLSDQDLRRMCRIAAAQDRVRVRNGRVAVSQCG